MTINEKYGIVAMSILTVLSAFCMAINVAILH